MASNAKSRWADDKKDAVYEAQKKQEKEAKRRAKAEKHRRVVEQPGQFGEKDLNEPTPDIYLPPTKRRRLSLDEDEVDSQTHTMKLAAGSWNSCRHVDRFEKLNHIEEGSYGWVSRAKETATGEIVALKKLKMENSPEGFPVTGLREIQTLMESRHPNIVHLREVVMGNTMNELVSLLIKYGMLIPLDSVFLVMDFLEHDLKTLQDDMNDTFAPSEVKTLMLQLTSAVEYLHSHWILHRDLKTSNLLMNNQGQIKIADFGMARYFGDPPPNLTQLVVTLWYRAPELLLGAETYGAEIDIWSIGCIFGELLLKDPLLQGKNEVDQLSKVQTLDPGAGYMLIEDRYFSYAAFHQRNRGQDFAVCRTQKRFDYPELLSGVVVLSERNFPSSLQLEAIC